MVDQLISQDISIGVSIIVVIRNRANHIERLLKSFLGKNTYRPVEFIIVDQDSEEDISTVIGKYAKDVFIRLLRVDNHSSFAESNNFASKKARFPYLLFLHDDIIYTADALPIDVEKLSDPNIGVIGIRLDDDPENLPEGQEPSIQHTGMTFEWDKDNEFHRPILISHDSIAEAKKIKNGFYPAVTGAFMLCRKADFEALHGFCTEYDCCFEDIDFCLRIGSELRKKCLSVNEVNLNFSGSLALNTFSNEAEKEKCANDIVVFKRRMETLLPILMGYSDDSAQFVSSFLPLKKGSTEKHHVQKLVVNHRTIDEEIRKENELMLMQLHQVQEELEVYYLKYQELKKQKSRNYMK